MHQQGTVGNHVEERVLGLVQASTSARSAPIALAKKKDGSACVKKRKLIDATRKDAIPLLRMNKTIDDLSGANVFTTLDLATRHGCD